MGVSQGNRNGDELSMDVAQGGNDYYLSFAIVFAIVFRWPTLLKILPRKSCSISHTLLQSPPKNLFGAASSCQQILIKRHLPTFSEIAVLSIIKVYFQLIIPLSNFGHSGCNFPCLPSVTGHSSTARSISWSMHWMQWGDDDIIKDTHRAPA